MSPLPASQSSPIAIIGAGASGIHMAVELVKRGYTNISIFEKSDRIGGKTYSFKQDGIAHEIGTTLFSISENSSLGKFIRDICPDFENQTIKLANTQIIKDGKSYSNLNFFQKFYLFVQFLIHKYRFYRVYRILKNRGFPFCIKKEDKEMFEILGISTEDFLQRYNLSFLKELLNRKFVAFGYGNLKTVPAYYGIMLLERNFLETSFYIKFLEGNDTLWKMAIEKYQLEVNLNSEVIDIDRSNYEKDKKISLSIKNDRDEINNLICDFAIVTAPYQLAQFLPQTAAKVFSSVKTYQYISRVVALEAEDNKYYSTEYLTKKVEVFDNELVAIINFSRLIELATKKTISNKKVHLCLQLKTSSNNQNKELNNEEKTLTKLFSDLKENSGRIADKQSVDKSHTWRHYFPQIDGQMIQNGLLQEILNHQGEDGFWYIGSSLAGELCSLVVDFNNFLLNKSI